MMDELQATGRLVEFSLFYCAFDLCSTLNPVVLCKINNIHVIISELCYTNVKCRDLDDISGHMKLEG